MKHSAVLAIAILVPSVACGADRRSGSSPGAGQDSGVAPDAPSGRPDAPPENGAVATIVMPRISGGAPAFASSGVPSRANDDDPTTSWGPDKLPAWIAYDLSGAPVAERQSILVVWNALHAVDYITASPHAGDEKPTDYTVEINAAPGGTSAPPTNGWIQVVGVSNGTRNTVEHPIELNGGNWVRMSITGSTDPTVAIDLDVFSTPNGNTDCWMFMGDSITFITMHYAFTDVPQRVHQARPERWPAEINAAIGGTSTATAVSVIDDTMSGYPGRYVVLAYGTNDDPTIFQMETLVQKVLAAGKIPVVPHMPWSDTKLSQGPQINQAIDALYARYPEIVRGPDLWSAFLNRTDLIPSGDVHPNSAGEAFLRQQWAQTMAAIP
jgi:hypothetical protein